MSAPGFNLNQSVRADNDDQAKARQERAKKIKNETGLIQFPGGIPKNKSLTAAENGHKIKK